MTMRTWKDLMHLTSILSYRGQSGYMHVLEFIIQDLGGVKHSGTRAAQTTPRTTPIRSLVDFALLILYLKEICRVIS